MPCKKKMHLNIELLKILIPKKSLGKLKMGDEDALCVQFAQYLRELTLTKDFPFLWFHVPNQFAISRPLFGLKQSWMGRISGMPDYVFLGQTCFAMEFKSKKGYLSKEQKIVQKWCEKVKVPYYVIKDLEEAKKIIHSETNKIV